MKKIYLVLFICMAFSGSKAATYTVAIAGTAYSPSVTTCAVGDVIIIQASGFHPNAEVSMATWNSNGTVAVGGGWGVQTTTFSYTAVSTGTNYFVCQNHVGLGMKGMIIVNSVGISEASQTFLNNYTLFPNPATASVKVSFGLNEASLVNIKLYTLAGEKVNTFANDLNLANGNYEYTFDLPPGISAGNYFIEVSSGNRKTFKKLLIVK